MFRCVRIQGLDTMEAYCYSVMYQIFVCAIIDQLYVPVCAHSGPRHHGRPVAVWKGALLCRGRLHHAENQRNRRYRQPPCRVSTLAARKSESW